MIASISKDNKLRLILLPRPTIAFSKIFNDKNNVIAEIGSQYGIHAFEIMNNLQPSSLYLIDKLEDVDKAKNNLKDFQQIKFITKTSVEASKDFSDNFFDLVYIDAEHTYNSVVEDIKIWTPKVKKWGIIGGHDWKLKEVQDAVRSIRGNAFYYMGDDWWFVKNNEFKYYFIG